MYRSAAWLCVAIVNRLTMDFSVLVGRFPPNRLAAWCTRLLCADPGFMGSVARRTQAGEGVLPVRLLPEPVGREFPPRVREAHHATRSRASNRYVASDKVLFFCELMVKIVFSSGIPIFVLKIDYPSTEFALLWSENGKCVELTSPESLDQLLYDFMHVSGRILCCCDLLVKVC